MTPEQAQQKAVQLWGPYGVAWFIGTRYLPYRVGTLAIGNEEKMDAKGWGTSWEEAFAKAEESK
jgi:hypothetical protein